MCGKIKIQDQSLWTTPKFEDDLYTDLAKLVSTWLKVGGEPISVIGQETLTRSVDVNHKELVAFWKMNGEAKFRLSFGEVNVISRPKQGRVHLKVFTNPETKICGEVAEEPSEFGFAVVLIFRLAAKGKASTVLETARAINESDERSFDHAMGLLTLAGITQGQAPVIAMNAVLTKKLSIDCDQATETLARRIAELKGNADMESFTDEVILTLSDLIDSRIQAPNGQLRFSLMRTFFPSLI